MVERDIIDLPGQDTNAEPALSGGTQVDTSPVQATDVEITDEVISEPQTAQAQTSGSSVIPEAELAQMTKDIIRMLKTVYDPEIPVDIYELGLIYKVDISDERLLTVDMTLTAPGCPVAGEMPGWVEGAVRGVVGVEDVVVNMTFEPPWTPERMSDEAKLELGWM